MKRYHVEEFWTGWSARGTADPMRIQDIADRMQRDGWRLIHTETRRRFHWGYWRNKVTLTFERDGCVKGDGLRS